MISSIWAMDVNWLIGKDNVLPWHYKEDLAYFKAQTEGKTVLMGHQTYLSLKSYYQTKPLPYGKIYVANLEPYHYLDATCITDVISFLKNFVSDLWIIGGKKIYEITLPYVDRLYITHILNRHEGNVYLKSFELSRFHLVSKKMADQMIFAVYERSR